MKMDQELYMCEVCGMSPAVTTHEVYYGTANRKVSIKNGFQVKICARCHDAAHYKIDIGIDVNRKLRERFQREYEKNHTRQEFIELIGHNYLGG
jgi:hypothetical protein